MSRLALGAGGFLVAAAIAAGWYLASRTPEPAPRAPDLAPVSAARIQVVPAVPAPALSPGLALDRRVERPSAAAQVAPSAASPADVKLVALEEEALRRIDVVPVLEAAGVDVHALRARPDAADILRHVAADELLTRAYMREYFSTVIYPHGYPTDTALRDARNHAETMIAQLNTEARVESLEHDLEADTVDVPAPEVYPESSGRVWVAPAE